jgi:glycosyltransferase involved in cell wall biosynthesis
MSLDTYIIVPCYNEGGQLRTTVSELLERGYKVVVVDDGSRTSAWEMLSDLPIHFLRHGINLGQGAALQTGMEFCRRLHADAVVHFDADGQHSADDIAPFLEALNDCDIVLGSRFLQSSEISQIPSSRRLLLRCARLVNYLFTGLWLTDAHNGLRALNAKALQSIELK